MLDVDRIYNLSACSSSYNAALLLTECGRQTFISPPLTSPFGERPLLQIQMHIKSCVDSQYRCTQSIQDNNRTYTPHLSAHTHLPKNSPTKAIFSNLYPSPYIFSFTHPTVQYPGQDIKLFFFRRSFHRPDGKQQSINQPEVHRHFYSLIPPPHPSTLPYHPSFITTSWTDPISNIP